MGYIVTRIRKGLNTGYQPDAIVKNESGLCLEERAFGKVGFTKPQWVRSGLSAFTLSSFFSPMIRLPNPNPGASMQVVSKAAYVDGKVNVERFSNDVIDAYAHSGDRQVAQKAALQLERDSGGKIGYTAAERMSKDALRNYEVNRERGLEHKDARALASSDTDQRFSSSGKDLLPQHRAKERGMSL